MHADFAKTGKNKQKKWLRNSICGAKEIFTVKSSYFTSNSSTSKMSAAKGGIFGAEPRSP